MNEVVKVDEILKKIDDLEKCIKSKEKELKILTFIKTTLKDKIVSQFTRSTEEIKTGWIFHRFSRENGCFDSLVKLYDENISRNGDDYVPVVAKCKTSGCVHVISEDGEDIGIFGDLYVQFDEIHDARIYDPAENVKEPYSSERTVRDLYECTSEKKPLSEDLYDEDTGESRIYRFSGTFNIVVT